MIFSPKEKRGSYRYLEGNMRKPAFVLAILIVLTLSPGVFAFQNEPDGFRGLKWGDPPREDMVEFYADRNEVTYMLPEDKMFLGDVPLYLVAYVFYGNRFGLAGLSFNGEKYYDKIETICRQRFGEQVEEGPYELKWTAQKAFIHLQYDYIEEDGYLFIGSTVIAMEKLRAHQERLADIEEQGEALRKLERELEELEKMRKQLEEIEAEKAERDW